MGTTAAEKIIPWSDLVLWRKDLRDSGRRLVVTNGCFDILHVGHISYLEQACALGDLLLVGVNTDRAVRELKGPGRPVNSEQDRALLLGALQAVGAVCIFPGTRATEFLARATADIYVKGGDYTLETLDREERESLQKAGTQITLLPQVAGKSTTSLIRNIKG